MGDSTDTETHNLLGTVFRFLHGERGDSQKDDFLLRRRQPKATLCRGLHSFFHQQKREHQAQSVTSASEHDTNLASVVVLEGDEDDARSRIEDEREDSFRALWATYAAELRTISHQTVWDGRTKMTKLHVRTMYYFLFKKMQTRLRQDFSSIFPQGISGTALSMSDVAACVACLLMVDIAIMDDDLHSLAMTLGPSQRLSLNNCPQERLFTYFSVMAFKSTSRLFRKDVVAFRRTIVGHFYNRESVPPKEHQLPLHGLLNAINSIIAHEQFLQKVPQFYEDALRLEREVLGSSLEADNMSIKVGFQKCDECGRGAFGVVYRCVNTANGKFLALKQLPLTSSRSREVAIRSEINMLRRLRHENIVSYFGCAFDHEEGVVSILMEYAPKSLRSIVDECHGLTLSLVKHYARKVLAGLAYLHDNHIIHRDIKAANILVNESGEIKVSDFGTAILTEDVLGLSRSLQGTPLFLAPEVIHGCLPTEVSDVWAFGCMLIELLTGMLPWQELASDTECDEQNESIGSFQRRNQASLSRIPIETLLFRIGTSNSPPQLPPDLRNNLPGDFLDMFDKCLKIDPCARPSPRQLLLHSFFNSTGGRVDESLPRESSSLLTSAGLPEHDLRKLKQHVEPATEVGEVKSLMETAPLTRSLSTRSSELNDADLAELMERNTSMLFAEPTADVGVLQIAPFSTTQRPKE